MTSVLSGTHHNVFGQWEMFGLCWPRAPAHWLWNKTMTMRLRNRLCLNWMLFKSLSCNEQELKPLLFTILQMLGSKSLLDKWKQTDYLLITFKAALDFLWPPVQWNKQHTQKLIYYQLTVVNMSKKGVYFTRHRETQEHFWELFHWKHKLMLEISLFSLFK